MSARGFYGGPAYVVSPAPKSYARGMCTVPGCKNEQRSEGMCQTHVVRKARGQSLETPVRVWTPRAEQPTCTAPDCERESYARGLCVAHSARAYRGTPLDTPVRARRVRGQAAQPIARVANVLRAVRANAEQTQGQFARRLDVHADLVSLGESSGFSSKLAARNFVSRVIEKCGHALDPQQREVLAAYVGGAK